MPMVRSTWCTPPAASTGSRNRSRPDRPPEPTHQRRAAVGPIAPVAPGAACDPLPEIPHELGAPATASPGIALDGVDPAERRGAARLDLPPVHRPAVGPELHPESLDRLDDGPRHPVGAPPAGPDLLRELPGGKGDRKLPPMHL